MNDDVEITLDNIDELWPDPTFEEMVAASKIIRQTPYGLQDGNGVDVSMIIENLKLTPEQRVRKTQILSQGMVGDRQHAKRIS